MNMEKRIKNALSESEVEGIERQMEQVFLLAGIQIEKGRKRKRTGFCELLWQQARFVGLRIWGIEAAAVLFLFFMVRSLGMEFYVFTPRKIAFCLSCGTVIASALLLPVLYRSVRFGMMEMESAAYFSYKRLLISRFLLFFGGEVFILTGAGTIAYAEQFLNGNMLVYVLLPMLLAGDGLLFFLKKMPSEKLLIHYTCYEGALLFMLCTGYWIAPRIFDGKYRYFGIGISVILLCYMICQSIRLIKQPEETLYV